MHKRTEVCIISPSIPITQILELSRYCHSCFFCCYSASVSLPEVFLSKSQTRPFLHPSSVCISKTQASQKMCRHRATPDVAHWGGFWSLLPKMHALYLGVKKQRASANDKITGQSSSKVSRSRKTMKGCRNLTTNWAVGSWTESWTKELALEGTMGEIWKAYTSVNSTMSWFWSLYMGNCTMII